MAITTDELCKEIRNLAPETIAESWDNSGIQIEIPNDKIEKILVCLEITNNVLDEAITEKVDFIITHHPLIFQPIKTVDNKNIVGNYIIKLIRNGISVYSAHTSFDSAWGGNNDDLAGKLELSEIASIDETNSASGGLGRTGRYAPPRRLEEIVGLVKKTLEIEGAVRYTGNPDKMISHVMVCAGAGADAIDAAKDKGCELLITGDVKFRHGIKATETDIALIDAEHYHTEKIFIANMAERLRQRFGNKAVIIESNIDQNPFRVL